MLGWLVPDHRVASVRELTPERLGRWQLSALLLDVDCTLKRYSAQKLPRDMVAWLKTMRAAGVGLCLVSNGRRRRIAGLAEELGVPYVAEALKPLPFRCRRAARKLGSPFAHTALVGDQLFADVLAARWAGLVSILVQPIHPEEEPWFTRIKRPLERLFLPGAPRQLVRPAPGD